MEWIGGRDKIDLVDYDLKFIDHNSESELGTIWFISVHKEGLLVKRITDTDAEDGIKYFGSYLEFEKEINYFYEDKPKKLEVFLESIRTLLEE